eukprot:TRINITY_DN15487_c0_g1_i1.p3 TRINITY_DN15487_c0_g1~~TRINITY_DN15487_c0_g1_i1.p3  ORF type:complete len:108 (-),score=10.26 TRINITY_DN15487_c0_g1_i1:88-411(-)
MKYQPSAQCRVAPAVIVIWRCKGVAVVPRRHRQSTGLGCCGTPRLQRGRGGHNQRHGSGDVGSTRQLLPPHPHARLQLYCPQGPHSWGKLVAMLLRAAVSLSPVLFM